MSSAVNWMLSSNELMWWKNSSLCAVWMTTKVSSTNLFQSGGLGDVLRAQISNSSIYIFAIMGLNGHPIAAPSNCS